MIIEVIRKTGPDRDEMIDAFAGLDYRNGITGEIRFDTYGNRMGAAGMMTVTNRTPMIIKKDE